ncbi:MAG: segregation/condensation protein A [Coxiellaceae bacterium]|nr:segregation/condensation protein A [Coxiellaceae bacterium]|tara:strand:+ start:181 stop:1047 length:867 start_codon:yes stop_codon:yes gene_type:complete
MSQVVGRTTASDRIEATISAVDPSAIVDQASIRVFGETVTELPQDLYIPPGALKVFLEAFEGPLDLLLYLIKKQHIDILNIPIVEITRQYVDYVELMQEMQIELASEYLVMAAMLAEIKSRLLLPAPPSADDDGEAQDPRAELMRRLQEYERFKEAAEALDELPRVDRDVFTATVSKPELSSNAQPPVVPYEDILAAFQAVMRRASLYTNHQVAHEALSVRERMTCVLERMSTGTFIEFSHLFDAKEGRVGVVVTLIAILELVRQKVLELVQAETCGPIHVKATTAAE